MTKPLLLQLCSFSSMLEGGLQNSFEVCRFFELNEPEAWLVTRAAQVRAVATGGHIGIPNALIARLPALGIVAINGVGFDKVDLDAARARGIRVTSTPNVLTEDVADLAVGLTISLLRGIVRADRFVRDGLWPLGERPSMRKVSGRRFGIVGLGRIGSAIAARLAPFGPVFYTDLNPQSASYEFVADLAELAARVDVLILASAASEATKNLVGANVLTALGPDGYLVNVARGSLVDEPELVLALREGRIAGAALDVFADEPRVPDSLIEMSDIILTPHIASATIETRQNMAQLVLDNLDAFVAGKPLPTALV